MGKIVSKYIQHTAECISNVLCPEVHNGTLHTFHYTQVCLISLFTMCGTFVLQRMNGSYVLHAWNVFSSRSPIRVGMGTLYDLVSSDYCPLTKGHVVKEGRVWGPY